MNEKKNTRVALRDDGMIALFDPESIYMPKIVLDQDEVKALRAYFQEERDTELNRWRDPRITDTVCYDVSDKMYLDVCVLNERTGVTKFYGRNDPSLWAYGSTGRTALRYFEAHPVKKNKPWEKAAQGDIWILTSHGGEVAPYTKIGEKWSREHVIDTYTDDYFIDGYRFWSKLQIESWERVKKNRAMKTGLILFVDTKKEMR